MGNILPMRALCKEPALGEYYPFVQKTNHIQFYNHQPWFAIIACKLETTHFCCLCCSHLVVHFRVALVDQCIPTRAVNIVPICYFISSHLLLYSPHLSVCLSVLLSVCLSVFLSFPFYSFGWKSIFMSRFLPFQEPDWSKSGHDPPKLQLIGQKTRLRHNCFLDVMTSRKSAGFPAIFLCLSFEIETIY